MEKEKIYKRTWFIILMLIFVCPVGIFLMWKYKDWSKTVKIIVAIASVIFMIIALANGNTESTKDVPDDKPKAQQEQTVNKDLKTEAEDESSEEAAEEKTPLEIASDMGRNWFMRADWDNVFQYKCKVHYVMDYRCQEVTDDTLKEYGTYVGISSADLQNGFGAEFKSNIYIFMDEDGGITHVFYEEADGNIAEIPLDSIPVKDM